MRKKLSWFRKQLGGIGKRLLWKTSKKMNLYILSLMQKEVFLKYAEIYGDKKTALNLFKEQFSEGANFILKDLWEGKTLSKIKLFVSESLKDLEYLSNLAAYVLLGPKAKDYFVVEFIPEDTSEEGIPKLITKNKKCVCCAVIKDEIHPDELGDLGFSDILYSAITTLLQMVLDYVSDKYIVECKETKCYLRGDSIGESTIYIKLKNPDTE